MKPRGCCFLDSEEGIVLLTVLWVIVVLMAIVMAFSFLTKTQADSTFSYKEVIKRDFLAEGGIAKAVMEIMYTRGNKNNALEDYSELWKADGTIYPKDKGEIEKDSYRVRITDESGKININDDKSLELLRNLLTNMGVDENEIDTIVDSMMDWRDPDDLHRINGAETEYYETLVPPYKAKNGDFDTIEEILWIKGITPEIYDGSGDDVKGLKDSITVYPKGRGEGKININTASRAVLLAIPGMTEEGADDLLEERNSEDFRGDVLPIDTGVDRSYIRYNSEGIYTIEACGITSEHIPEYGIRVVLRIREKEYDYLQWTSRSPLNLKDSDDESEREIIDQEDSL